MKVISVEVEPGAADTAAGVAGYFEGSPICHATADEARSWLLRLEHMDEVEGVQSPDRAGARTVLREVIGRISARMIQQ